VNREHIQRLLGEAAKLTKHRDYVIIGSLSVLGVVASPPDTMAFSIDIDLYPKNDPGRTAEIAAQLGLGSEFEQIHGYYADVVSPMLPTLPEGWQQSGWCASNSRTVSLAGFWNPTTPRFPSTSARNLETVNGYGPGSRLAFFRPLSSNTECARP
jgi:hypothetical protein